MALAVAEVSASEADRIAYVMGLGKILSVEWEVGKLLGGSGEAEPPRQSIPGRAWNEELLQGTNLAQERSGFQS